MLKVIFLKKTHIISIWNKAFTVLLLVSLVWVDLIILFSETFLIFIFVEIILDL